MMLGQACEQIGETDLALDALGRAARLSGGNSKPMSVRGYVLARAGQGAAARDVLEALEDAARSTYVPPYAMALIDAGLAEADAMVAWLERAYAVRTCTCLSPGRSQVEWMERRPRFRVVLDRCGFVCSTRRPNA
jgi:hypothetical protein